MGHDAVAVGEFSIYSSLARYTDLDSNGKYSAATLIPDRYNGYAFKDVGLRQI